MQEGSPCAQELRSGGRGGCCVPRWSWRLPRVTPGEARGEGRGLAQGSQAREMQGCWAVPGRGGVWGGQAQARSLRPRGPRGWLSPRPALGCPRQPRSPPPPPHRPSPLPGAPVGPGLSPGAPCRLASPGRGAVRLPLFVPGDLSAPGPHGPMSKCA